MHNLAHLLAAVLLLGAGMMSPHPVQANPEQFQSQVQKLQHSWALITYQFDEKRKEEAFTELEQKAQALAEQYPDRAEPKLWQAIILSTHAGVHGGLGALGMVDNARALLLQAKELDSEIEEGSVFTVLGSLYYQVPGWPLGFGDDDKARELLLKALQINPNGIDPNYFYGDFLYRNGEMEAALAVLNKALQAPPRPGRPLADEGRREEIRALIARIHSKS